MHERCLVLLKKVNAISLETLAKANLAIENLSFTLKRSASSQLLLKVIPSEISDLIQSIKMQEEKVIEEIKKEKQHVEIDDILKQYIECLPSDPVLITFEMISKLNILMHLFDQFDNDSMIIIELINPIRNFIDGLASKQLDILNIIALQQKIDQERDQQVALCYATTDYFLLKNKREEIKKELKKIEIDEENKKILLARLEIINTEMGRIDNELKVADIIQASNQKKALIEHQVKEKQIVIEKSIDEEFQKAQLFIFLEAVKEFLLKICDWYLDVVEKEIRAELNKKNALALTPACRGAYLEFDAVLSLKKVLNAESLSLPEKIDKFERKFKEVKKIMFDLQKHQPKKNHSSSFFVKAISTVIGSLKKWFQTLFSCGGSEEKESKREFIARIKSTLFASSQKVSEKKEVMESLSTPMKHHQ